MIDWEQQYYKPVRCVFKPRKSHKGRELKPGMAEKAGMELDLMPLWKMDESDSYPGEWALTTPPGCGLLLDTVGIGWIASGDVEVIGNVE